MDALQILLDSYQAATESWITEAVRAGTEIFRRVAALELIVFGFYVALKARSAGAEAVFPELAWKLFMIALLFTALLLYPVWVPVITPSFVELAGDITGFETLDPTVIAGQGIALSLIILGSSMASGWVFGDPVSALLAAGVMLLVLLAFIAIAAILTKTLIESWIVLAVGPLFLGFSPFRLTAQLADNFIVWAFQVAIRMFFLIALVSASRNVAIRWAIEIAQSRFLDFGTLLQVLAGALILAFVLITLPTRISEVLTRGWQLGIRQGLAE